jgi:hypothetical protein
MSDEWTVVLVDLGHALGPQLTLLPDQGLDQLTQEAVKSGPGRCGLSIDGSRHVVGQGHRHVGHSKSMPGIVNQWPR